MTKIVNDLEQGISLWSDVRLPENVMNHLWMIINHSPTRTEVIRERDNKDITTLADFKTDKDNWFFENVLKKECTEASAALYKFPSPPKFELSMMWVNHQKQYEFIPPHIHEAFYSFVVFMKIPTHWKEQHALSFCRTIPGVSTASDFQFLWGTSVHTQEVTGHIQTHNFPLCSEDEGRMLVFPSWLHHQVFPFYGTEEERITISGNIILTNQAECSNLQRRTI
jgi:hypothetical protein